MYPNIVLNVRGRNKIVTFFLHRFSIVSANHPAFLHLVHLTLVHGIWIAAVHEQTSSYFTYRVNLLKCYRLTFRVGVRLTKNCIFEFATFFLWHCCTARPLHGSILEHEYILIRLITPFVANLEHVPPLTSHTVGGFCGRRAGSTKNPKPIVNTGTFLAKRRSRAKLFSRATTVVRNVRKTCETHANMMSKRKSTIAYQDGVWHTALVLSKMGGWSENRHSTCSDDNLNRFIQIMFAALWPACSLNIKLETANTFLNQNHALCWPDAVLPLPKQRPLFRQNRLPGTARTNMQHGDRVKRFRASMWFFLDNM